MAKGRCENPGIHRHDASGRANQYPISKFRGERVNRVTEDQIVERGMGTVQSSRVDISKRRDAQKDPAVVRKNGPRGNRMPTIVGQVERPASLRLAKSFWIFTRRVNHGVLATPSRCLLGPISHRSSNQGVIACVGYRDEDPNVPIKTAQDDGKKPAY